MLNGFFFVVRHGGVFDRIVSIETPEIIIGRDTGCGLRLVHDCVSQTHARLERTECGYLIRDMESRNGTLINRRLVIDSHPLQEFDVVGIAPFSLKVFLSREGAQADAKPSEDSTRSLVFDPNPATIREELKKQLPPSLHAVYEALMEGNTEKEIARHCGLGLSTVHYSVRRIFEILNVHSHPELIAECHKRQRRKIIDRVGVDQASSTSGQSLRGGVRRG